METVIMFRVCKFSILSAVLLVSQIAVAEQKILEVSTVADLARTAGGSEQAVRLKPGTYRMSDYLTEEVISSIKASVQKGGRPPVWMINFSGNNNRFDFTGAVLEIETDVYAKLPPGYIRCLFVSGSNNTFVGLTICNTGKDVGSNGNIMSLWGDNNRVENFILHVFGSYPHGYGDLLGKGGPNIVRLLQKQSAMMIGGTGNTVVRCSVFSRAFGHCFYVQKAKRTRIQDCYAEGEVRTTNEMLRDNIGPAFDLGFRSVYENRDGRYIITPGYTKSLSEDGFRTYGGVSETTIVNCTAMNTRAGFEIGGNENDADKTVVENCVATGCERAYLLGSNVVVLNSRGDVAHGPLLYLRGGKDSDVDLQLIGEYPISTVHALATIAGTNHRIRLSAGTAESIPALPIMLGFGMPQHGEMASPIHPLSAQNIHLISEVPNAPVIRGAEAADDCVIESKGRVITDEETKRAPK